MLDFPVSPRHMLFPFCQRPLVTLTEAEKIEDAPEFFAFQLKLEFALFKLLFRIAAIKQLIRSAIPDPVHSSPVISLGDIALKIKIFHRVVFGWDGKAPYGR